MKNLHRFISDVDTVEKKTSICILPMEVHGAPIIWVSKVPQDWTIC